MLYEDALDHHIAWHLNALGPVALTSGGLMPTDSAGSLLAGALDNRAAVHKLNGAIPMVGAEAFRRDGISAPATSAILLDQTATDVGHGYWTATSAMMMRRSTIDLVLPDEIDIGRYSADGYLAYTCHAVGGSVLIDAPMAYYRRHGNNGYSSAAIMGIGTLPHGTIGSSWAEVAGIFGAHMHKNMDRFRNSIGSNHIERLLQLTSGRHAPRARGALPEKGLSAGQRAAWAMRYPDLLKYAAGRVWRGGARRVLRQAPGKPVHTVDALPLQQLLGHISERTARGLRRRTRR